MKHGLEAGRRREPWIDLESVAIIVPQSTLDAHVPMPPFLRHLQEDTSTQPDLASYLFTSTKYTTRMQISVYLFQTMNCLLYRISAF